MADAVGRVELVHPGQPLDAEEDVGRARRVAEAEAASAAPHQRADAGPAERLERAGEGRAVRRAQRHADRDAVDLHGGVLLEPTHARGLAQCLEGLARQHHPKGTRS